MPFVHIRVTREGVTAAQKAALIAGATGLLADVLGKHPSVTHVVIDEVEPENWGLHGLPVTALRQQAEAT